MTEHCATCRKEFDVNEGANCYDCQYELLATRSELALELEARKAKFREHIEIMRTKKK
jgi:hypothetical protein